MYLIRFLPNFAVFCVFLWISRLCDGAKYQWAASFTLYKLATKNLHLATIFLQLVAKRRPENFSNFEPWFQAGYTWAPTLPKDLESRCRSNQPTSIELSLSYPLAFPPLIVKMQCLHCLLQRWATALLTRQSCCGSFWAEMNLQVAVHETAYVSTRTADKKSCWSKERAITVYQP